MKFGTAHKTLVAGLLLVSVSCASWAQRGRSADRIDRVTRTVENAQRRAEAAQDRIARIPEQAARAEKAQERAGRAPNQVERALRAERAARAGRIESRSAERARGKGGEGNGGRRQRAEAQRGGKSEAKFSEREQSLADAQQQRQQALVRLHPGELEMTTTGPAVRAQVVAIDPSPAALAAALRAGFTLLSQETIEGLDIRSVTLRTPRGMAVDQALAQLARHGEFSPNHLHLPTSAATMPSASAAAPLAGARVEGRPALGIIDGGVARHSSLGGAIEQRGFAQGAPAANAHATAVASLAVGQGPLRGAFPGASLLVADIYGRDPTGGNAVALIRAIGWMAARGVPVVAITLAGPSNPLVAKAVTKAFQRGLYIVAPVGNGGPAAPPAFPASYPQVVAVTGVDRRNRVLIESGRCPSLDYAAPAAGFRAANAAGGLHPVRGTSFAVPFVAARLAALAKTGPRPLSLLDREAVDLGPRGADRLYGRGLVCSKCRPAS
ncbi:MAG: S8 family serine peptidase [Pseudomonadota bacterium]|nr:S8 family serine peptidase [Pseudomonadota bacterium]